MSHIIELTDEQYETLRKVAARDQETPEQLLQRMVNALTETQGVVYHSDEELLRALGADDEELAELAQLETADHADAWFRRLGATDEQIAEAKRIARERGGDANASREP